MINRLFSIMILFFTSCKEKNIVKIQNENFDMETTILHMAELEINKEGSIERNKVVALELPNSKHIRILRVIGTPGDTVEIKNGVYFINSLKLMSSPTSKKIYVVYNKDPEKMKNLANYSYEPYSSNYYSVSLSFAEYENIKIQKLADSVFTVPVDSSQIQQQVLNIPNTLYRNIYYLGPLIIPQQNDLITSSTLSIIPTFLSEKSIGKKIEQDFFFCIGDNFPESKDSRYIGLIPRDRIIGVVENFKNPKTITIKN